MSQVPINHGLTDDMMRKETFSLELKAENILIEDCKNKFKVHITLDGISIGEIEKIVICIATRGDKTVRELKRWVYRELDFPRLESLYEQHIVYSEIDNKKRELQALTDMELIQHINNYMATPVERDLNFLIACRQELSHRRIDCSSINDWTTIRDWTKVSFYNIRGRKFIKPVDGEMRIR
jgi:hypothetical protein